MENIGKDSHVEEYLNFVSVKYSTDRKEFVSFSSQRLNVWISLVSKIHVFKLKNQKGWYILIPSISTMPSKDFWFVTRSGFELFWTVSFVRKSQLCHTGSHQKLHFWTLPSCQSAPTELTFSSGIVERTNFRYRGGNDFLRRLAWISLGLH